MMTKGFRSGPGHACHPFFSTAMFALCLILPCLPDSGYTQVTPPITSSGLNTTVAKSGNVYDITGGTRPGSGPNLFHSFGEFGVPTSNVANFLNEAALPTSNILGRVTGGNPSNIFGTLQTTGFGNANLFLMNPAGIVFGPNASLNVGGSVNFTTADYLRLADGAKFNAVPGPQDAAISSAPVAAFGFLGSNPGAITVQGGRLAVSEGYVISLVGGNIDITDGTLQDGTAQPALISAPSGQINLVSAASPGEVLLTSPVGQSVEPAVNDLTTFGNISLSRGASLDTSADTAGRVVIRAGQFTMDDASIKAKSASGQGIVGTTASPAISVTAETVSLANGTHITADSEGPAPAGGITFNVGTLITEGDPTHLILLNPGNLSNFSENLITSDNRSPALDAGPAGRITMQGVEGPGTPAASITLKDTAVSARVFGGTADTTPSSVTITADSLVLINEDFPNERGGGAATIVVTTVGPAPAGDIDINVNTLRINANPDESPIQGAKRVFVNTSNHAGSTAGPTGRLTISGIGPETTDPARLVALNIAMLSSGVDGGSPTTPPGSITITSDTLSLTGQTIFFANTFGDVLTPAGNIAFNVNTLRANVKPDGTLVNGQLPSSINSSSPAWQAGTLTVSGLGPETSDAANLLALNNIEFTTEVAGGTSTLVPATITMSADTLRLTGSTIKTDTLGTTPAGNISISAPHFLADQASKISSSTSAAGPGGNISIHAGQSATVRGDTRISAESSGSGNAGNIAINAGSQFLSQNASVTTKATQASGGNIVIQATDAIRLINSQLSTSVQGGPNTSSGNITLDPAVVTLQNSQVLAQAVQGAGGNINIIAGTFLADPTSVVSASSQFGLSGSVNIQSPVSSLSGSLATLPQRPLQVQHLLQQRCAAQANGQLSSLVVAGRDTLPYEPGGWLPSSLALLSEDVSTFQSNPLPGADLAPHQPKMIVSGQLYEQPAPSPQQGLTSWAAGCGS